MHCTLLGVGFAVCLAPGTPAFSKSGIWCWCRNIFPPPHRDTGLSHTPPLEALWRSWWQCPVPWGCPRQDPHPPGRDTGTILCPSSSQAASAFVPGLEKHLLSHSKELCRHLRSLQGGPRPCSSQRKGEGVDAGVGTRERQGVKRMRELGWCNSENFQRKLHAWGAGI